MARSSSSNSGSESSKSSGSSSTYSSSSSGTTSSSSPSRGGNRSRSRTPPKRKDDKQPEKRRSEEKIAKPISTDERGRKAERDGKSQPMDVDKKPVAKDTPETARLHVGHLTRNVGEEHVREIFSTFGKLKSVEMAIDRMVNLPRGFCYVEFESRPDAEKARELMDGGQIDGNVISVQFVLLPRRRSPPPPSSGRNSLTGGTWTGGTCGTCAPVPPPLAAGPHPCAVLPLPAEAPPPGAGGAERMGRSEGSHLSAVRLGFYSRFSAGSCSLADACSSAEHAPFHGRHLPHNDGHVSAHDGICSRGGGGAGRSEGELLPLNFPRKSSRGWTVVVSGC